MTRRHVTEDERFKEEWELWARDCLMYLSQNKQLLCRQIQMSVCCNAVTLFPVAVQ